MIEQLPLGVGLRDSAAFENFHPGANAQAVRQLRAAADPFIYLWGAPGAGKTHLLQAACAATLHLQQRAAYLPLREAERFAPGMIQGWENLELVCVDDIDAIAGRVDWERALFNLYNSLREQEGRLIVAAGGAPAGLRVTLPDLRSRLGHGLVFQLQELDDAGKLAAMRLRARRRGFELPEEAGMYLLNRYQRDMHSLCRLLDVLDTASLAAHRRLTIPFVKSVLPEEGTAAD